MTRDPGIVGRSRSLRRALDLARRVAPSRLPILLVGETGTGKELFAQAIHQWSGRSGALVDVNCGALPRDLLDRELFGHRRGSFTGAISDGQGLVSAADRGTLFLDELTSFPIGGQTRLLRFLENGQVRRVGETRSRKVNVRVVSAAQTQLEDMRATGEFRGDLLHRLSGMVIILPPLREREDDVSLLGRAFAGRWGADLAPGCEEVLRGYPWPGNVRELRAAIERAAVLVTSPRVSPETLAEAIRLGQSSRGGPHLPMLDLPERRRMIDLCRRFGGDAQRIAKAVGVSRATLYRRLKRLQIPLRKVTASTPH